MGESDQVSVGVSVKERGVNHLLHRLHETSSSHLSLHSPHIALQIASHETKPLLLCVRPVAHRVICFVWLCPS